MGNCQSGKSVVQSVPVTLPKGKTSPEHASDSDDEGHSLFSSLKNKEELTSYVDRFQEINFRRLHECFKNDKELFILNQLLMSIQFFQNFDKSLLEGQEFKRAKELEVNEKLSKMKQDGVLPGERRLTLMHGMGEILANNFIYSSKTSLDSDGYKIYSRKKLRPSTFLCEGILPLDFYLNYENYELYSEREWESLGEDTYFSPTDAQLFRFCMEEPDERNRIPRGYVRLLNESKEKPYSGSTTKNSSLTYEYSNTSDIYMDQMSETKSSYASSLVSEEEDTTINIRARERLGNNSTEDLSHIQLSTPGLRYDDSMNWSNGNQPGSTNRLEINNSLFPRKHESETNPTILIEEPPTSSFDRLQDELSYKLQDLRSSNSNGLLRPTWTPTMQKKLKTKQSYKTNSDDDLSDQFLPTVPRLPSTGSVRSSNSVGFSAGIRRRPMELKLLSQYHRKEKLDLSMYPYPEISPECLIQVKIEREDSSENESDDSGASYETKQSSLSSEPCYTIKSFLDSSQFSALACSDFNLIGVDIGINWNKLQEAQVLGTTIRIPVDHKHSINKDKEFRILHTFTPVLHSKLWPQKSLYWFRQRLLRSKYSSEKGNQSVIPDEMMWPSRFQVENIESFGCDAIPHGFHSVDFFNTQQAMEWQLNFSQGENLLLNSFKNVHWRAYIMCAILFRAYVFPMGPMGIGLEHIRNIIYQMCEHDYVYWDYEDGGVHLKSIFGRLYDSLGKRQMPNFFVQRYDMLKSSAPENTRKVQAYLNIIRENPIVFCIYSLKNLKCLQDTFYPELDLKNLYRLITAPSTELLLIANPYLRLTVQPLDTNNNTTSKRDHKKNLHEKQRLESNFDVVNTQGSDRQRDKMIRKYNRYLDKQRKAQQDKIKAENELKTTIPEKERRNSIDLDTPVVSKFTNRRMVMIIELFLQHFLKMAEKAITFRSYAEATMYTLHVQNLCRLMKGIRLESTHMEMTTINSYMRQADQIKTKLGAKTAEYVKCKLSHLDLPDETSAMFLNQSTHSAAETLSSNFLLSSRTTLTVPVKHYMPKKDISGIGMSLHFPAYDSNVSQPNFNPDFDGAQLFRLENLARHRRMNIRYIQSDNRSDVKPASANVNTHHQLKPDSAARYYFSP